MMIQKRWLLVILLVIITLGAHAQSNKVEWYRFEKAVELNQEEPKKILVDVYTDWCGWCKKMKKETFNHPAIAQYINQHFYPVRFNAEGSQEVTFKGKTFRQKGTGSRKTHELAIALLQGRMSYPSVAYMDEKNQLITAVPGYYSPKDIEPILKFFVSDAYKNQSFEEFKKEFTRTLTD